MGGAQLAGLGGGFVQADVPGRQFGDALDRMVGDSLQHVAQIRLRIDPVQLGRSDQRVDGRGAVAALVRA